jgi:hypothetical protein
MPSEMLSGPDLGAGFLHQLTSDRDGDRTTFTYHAQDGGQDANGPPKGPLDVLGFVHPPAACAFGGPRCWHRRFLLPFSETPRVRQCYNRNRFVLQAMIDQAYSGLAPAVDSALDEVVNKLTASPAPDPGDWYVGGSMAARLLGARIEPHDIDLGVSRSGADRLGDRLAEYLIEPTSTTDWPHAGIVRGARAFVGTFASGARVEWAVSLEDRRPRNFDEWSGPEEGVRLTTAHVNGRTVRVTRPEYALVRAAEEQRPDAVATIASLIRKIGPDTQLLDSLLADDRTTEAGRAAVRDALGR